MQTEYIRKYAGPIIGTITTAPDGMRTAQLFGGKILATYNPKTDETQEWAGKIIAKGDILSALIWQHAK